jgi:starch synthase
LVRRTGGLADTVTDADPASVAAGRATGFLFDAATPQAFERCARRALAAWQDAGGWQALMRSAMAQKLGWDGPARDYLALYRQALG